MPWLRKYRIFRISTKEKKEKIAELEADFDETIDFGTHER